MHGIGWGVNGIGWGVNTRLTSALPLTLPTHEPTKHCRKIGNIGLEKNLQVEVQQTISASQLNT